MQVAYLVVISLVLDFFIDITNIICVILLIFGLFIYVFLGIIFSITAFPDSSNKFISTISPYYR